MAWCTSDVYIKPFPNDKFQILPNWKSLQMTILNLMKIVETKLVENTTGQREIACNKHFLLVP